MVDRPEPPSDAPLDGFVVLDLASSIAGSYCTKLLADFGARVVKIEPPDGDPLRRSGPFPGGQADPEASGTFLHLNTNKESVVVDPAAPGGVDLLRTLVRAADVVVETGRPGELADLGLDPVDLRADQPALVVSSVTPFGQTGPYAGYRMSEIVAFAMGGPMNSSGLPDREPVKMAGNVVQMQSGATAAVATLAALYHALETGRGQHVDVATFETQNGSLDRRRYYLLSYEYSGSVTRRDVVVGSGRPAAGGRFAAADGKLITSGRVWPTHVARMVGVVDDPELHALWAAKGEAMMADDVDAVNAAIARWAAARPARAAMREAQAAGWPVVVVNDPLSILSDDHLLARGFWVTAPHPVAGALPYCGPPWRIDGGGWHLLRTAPTLGQDTDTVRADLIGDDPDRVAARRLGPAGAGHRAGPDRSDPDPGPTAGGPAHPGPTHPGPAHPGSGRGRDPMPVFGPLAGIRVLDMTMALAGAFATMMLADLGAEVIKVESRQHYPTPSRGPRFPPRGDNPVARAVGRDYPDNDPGPDPWNRLSWFNSHGRNKRDMTVDITTPRGKELFLRLIERSDGFLENNTAGLLEHLGIGPDLLLERNPRLIVVRMPPLGLSGPDVTATGFGWHFEELGGFLEVQGYPEGPPVGSIFMDAATGPAGANGFLMALLRRRRTGRGCVVEVAQVENMTVHLGDVIMEAAMTGSRPGRWGNRAPDAAPQGVYRCAGDDQWITVSVRDDAQWAALVELLGRPEGLGADGRSTLSGRLAAHDAIDAAIETWTSRRTKHEAFHALQAVGVTAGPVLDEADAASDPHLHARGFFHHLEHHSAGGHLHPGANFQLSGTPPRIWRAAPVVGQDNEYVYKEILGVGDDEYAELVAEGHIGDTYV